MELFREHSPPPQHDLVPEPHDKRVPLAAAAGLMTLTNRRCFIFERGARSGGPMRRLHIYRSRVSMLLGKSCQSGQLESPDTTAVAAAVAVVAAPVAATSAVGPAWTRWTSSRSQSTRGERHVRRPGPQRTSGR